MLEKCSKLPKKNAGNHLSQNSHINQQVRKYWDMIHKFRGKPSVPITCLNLNDQIIMDDSQKAETLAQHYDNMTKSYLPSCKTAKEEIFKIYLPNIENERNNLKVNLPFSNSTTHSVLNTTQHQGRTPVSYEMLKQLPDPSKKELIKLINISWERGNSLRMKNCHHNPNYKATYGQIKPSVVQANIPHISHL